MTATRITPDYLYYLIYGSGYIDAPWSRIWGQTGDWNDHWTLQVRAKPETGKIGVVDMGRTDDQAIIRVDTSNYSYSGGVLIYKSDSSSGGSADYRTADRVTLDHQEAGPSIPYILQLHGVDFVDGPVEQETHLQIVTPEGVVTDGTLASIAMHVGDHHMTFTGAARDSTIFMGSGYDTIDFVDDLDVPGEQFWSVIRRHDGELDVYSLFSGYRVQLGGGHKGWTAAHSHLMNYGEVEEISLRNSKTGGTDAYLPGVDLPNGDDRGTATNIDLRSDGKQHSDSFNLAYFNFIRYTSDNVWAGEATIHDGTATGFSTPGDRTVRTAKYGVQAPDLSGTMSVIGASRNGTHDLIVAEQETAIDGNLRVYTFNVQSGLYNEFNRVYLGDSFGRVVDMSGQGSGVADRVALYGFGGNDTLIAGSGRDYVFGGLSTYNTVSDDGKTIVAASGNIVTGGKNADYFGVGATDDRGRLIDATKAILGATGLPTGAPQGFLTGSASTGGTDSKGTGEFWASFATDVITDWQAGLDTLVVLENGVAIIGGLRSSTGDENLISLDGNNIIDLRAYTAVATSDQNFTGARGGDGWDAAVDGTLQSGKTTLQYIFENQYTRDSKSITNEDDVTVVNDGLVVIRGLAGNDTIYGSPGNDYIYGNRGNNFIDISNGGNDRIYYDTFDGSAAKHFVTGFTVSNGGVNSAEADKFFVNKRVIDAFKSGAGYNDRSLTANDVTGDYVRSQKYDPGLNFLHSPFYNPSIAAPNTVHNSEDGNAYYENERGGSDQTSSLIGLGMVVAGRILLGVPFVGPIIGGALIASGTLLNGVGFEVITTTPHQNATFDGNVGAYLNVLSDAGTSTTNGQLLKPTHNLTGLDTSIRFHQFFEAVDAEDGYVPVVEFTAHPGQGIYGYFALHSNTHTFVYLVASKDNLVEDSEAILVAQINGLLKAEDFAIYDGEADIYNAAVQAPIVIVEPTVTDLRDGGDEPFIIDLNAAEKRFADVNNPLKLTVTVPGDVRTGQIRLYDGITLIYDSALNTPIDSNVTLLDPTVASNITTFVLVDNRNIGTVAQQTDSAPLDQDNQFILRDSIVNYTVEFVDSVTGIGTRDSVGRVDVAGGDVIIDGGGGDNDMLTIFETNDFINNAGDEKIIGMERILLAATQDPTTGVYSPITLDLSRQSDGFYIVSGDSGDIITGSSGADTIFGGGGVNSINAGGGDDTVVYTTKFVADADGQATSTISKTANQQLAEDALVVGGPGFDTLKFDTDSVASNGTVSQKINLELSDSDFANVSEFEAILLNGTGSQTLTLGNAANEAFISGVTVTANTAGDGLIFSAAHAGWTRATNVTGTNNDDILTGGAGVDILNGGAGNDILEGGAGADVLTGGTGTNTYVFNTGDVAVGETVNFTIGATEIFRVDSSTDFSNLNGGTSLLTGLSTVNIADGQSATFTAAQVNGLNFSTNGNASTSLIVNGTGSDETINLANLTFSGGLSGVVINGGGGDDVITGGAGADTLTGGAGADVLTGGDGADIFVFNSSSDSAASVAANTTRTFDRITDFTSGTDKLLLDAVGAIDFLATANANVTAVSVSNVADFASLDAAIKAQVGGALVASDNVVAQVYDVTLTGTGLAASGMARLVIVNDGDTGLDADDLMIQLSGTSSASIAHTDFLFIA